MGAAIEQHVQHHRVEGDGIRLHCVSAGRGPTVLLLHGFPQTWTCWRHVIPRLADAGYRVVAPDLRGCGGSDKPHPVRAYRATRLVADVEALAERFGGPVHLVGHDWGALVAWYVAMRAPHRLRTLSILQMPHPVRYLESLRGPEQRSRSWYVWFFQLPRLPERAILADDARYVRKMFARDVRDPSKISRQDVDGVVEALREPGAVRGAVNYYRAALRYDVWTAPWLIRRIDVPTLLLWGDRDRYLGLHGADVPLRWVSDVRVEHFPEASHWLPEEDPERVSEHLIAHFYRR